MISALRLSLVVPMAAIAACSIAAEGCTASRSAATPCGAGGTYQEEAGSRFCAYSEALVIEGGFTCPSSLPFRIDLDGAAVCSDRDLDRDELPPSLCRRIDRRCGDELDGGLPLADAGPAADGGMTADGAPACPADIGGAVDTACSVDGQYCGGEVCTDPCQFCNLIHCEGGFWRMMEAFPQTCFPCGDGECVEGEQYCEERFSGLAGGSTTYACMDAPAACVGNVTCACLTPAIPAGMCEVRGDVVVVSVALP